MNCRYCSEPLAENEAVVTHSYWQGLPFYCHRSCKQDGERAEAIECQTIDADCNDCRHFERWALETRMLSAIENGVCVLKKTNMGWFHGLCQKFNKETTASPKKWTGHECFEHRKSI